MSWSGFKEQQNDNDATTRFNFHFTQTQTHLSLSLHLQKQPHSLSFLPHRNRRRHRATRAVVSLLHLKWVDDPTTLIKIVRETTQATTPFHIDSCCSRPLAKERPQGAHLSSLFSALCTVFVLSQDHEHQLVLR